MVRSVRGGIVGRDAELDALRAVLAASRDTPGGVVLEGEAGIGKSTLWRAAVEEARALGLRVLAAQPAEGERGLAFSALGDLLEPVLDEVLPALAPPRRRALEIALLVDDDADPLDPRAIGVAVRDAFELLQRAGRTVLAIDDVQWLDGSSSRALSFALRRTDRPLTALLARRVAEGIGTPELAGAFAPGAVEPLPVEPLSVGALQTLLHDRLGRTFARPVLLRIHETSGGNPFYALELAQALGPDVDATRPLPVPETLESLVAARVDGLPKATRDALALAAAAGSPTVDLLRSAGLDEDALEPAVRARVVESSDGLIRFTHPLLASVVYRGLPPRRARAVHAALAASAEDPIERARHLALSSTHGDADVALQLDRAATLARERGAVVTVVELAEHALRLTPPEAGSDRHRRAVDVCRAHTAAGDPARARTLATELCAQAAPGARRAEALLLLGEIDARRGSVKGRLRLWDDALREAAEEPALRATINWRLAYFGRMSRGLAWAEPHARAAVDLADEVGDDGLTAVTLATLAQIRFNRGRRDGVTLARRAHALGLAVDDPSRTGRTTEVLGHVLVWSAEIERGRALLAGEIDEWGARDELRSASAHWYLSLLELRAGCLRVAAAHAAAAMQNRLSYELVDPGNLFPVALVAAHRGHLDEARAQAAEAMAMADALDRYLNVFDALLGLVDLWGGDPVSAAGRFDAAERSSDAQDFGEPSLRWWRAEYVEALVELGRLDEAELLLADWEAAARPVGRAWVLAEVERCRGLVASARGECDLARHLAEESVAGHAAAGTALGQARALLALGVVRRRGRQKRAAREAIAEALALFEECGAELFAEKARAELGRIGGRTREVGLTPAEQRVAALVAEGRTNREVAAALVLGERTVETHLTHIYAKLRIRSRTELARVYEPIS